MRGLGERQSLRRALVGAALVLGLAAEPADADTASQTIQGNGGLTNIRIGNALSCQALHAGDTANLFFPASADLGDCGTFVAVDGKVFGPDFATNSGSSFPLDPNVYVPFTPGSQSVVTGAGLADVPFQLTTTVTLGTTGLTVTETDSYVVPDETYRTDIVVSNSGTVTKTAKLYRGADCYLQGSDIGYGVVTAAGSPACSGSANNTPSGQIEEFAPQTPGFTYLEASFTSVWLAILSQSALANTCDCTVQEDNGAAVAWDISVPAGGSVTYSVINNFSNVGQVVGAPASITGPAEAITSTDALLTGQVNPEGKAVTDCHFNFGETTDYGKTVPCDATPAPGTGLAKVSGKVSGLDSGTTYHYAVSATTDGGTTTGGDKTLTTQTLAPPTIGESANLLPVSGTVFVKLPKGRASALDAAAAVRAPMAITKGAGFIPVTEARQIPLGSELDARQGTVQLVAASTTPDITQSVRLAGGVFTATQAKAGPKKGLTTFTLRVGGFRGAPSYKGCPSRLQGRNSTARASKTSKSVVQTLNAKDKGGKFGTRGKYSAGTVRGTSWSTAERCDGTLTTVKRGIVDVRDFARRTTVTVRAHHKYLAKASVSKKQTQKKHS